VARVRPNSRIVRCGQKKRASVKKKETGAKVGAGRGGNCIAGAEQVMKETFGEGGRARGGTKKTYLKITEREIFGGTRVGSTWVNKK